MRRPCFAGSRWLRHRSRQVIGWRFDIGDSCDHVLLWRRRYFYLRWRYERWRWRYRFWRWRYHLLRRRWRRWRLDLLDDLGFDRLLNDFHNLASQPCNQRINQGYMQKNNHADANYILGRVSPILRE